MQPVPYVFFGGNCREAVTKYGEIFGNAPAIMAFSDMPAEDQAQMPGVPADVVMHASVKIGDGQLYASDDPTDEFGKMSGCNVAVELPNDDETRRVWAALADGGEVRMDLMPMFWTSLFGTLTDAYGIRWMIMTASPSE